MASHAQRPFPKLCPCCAAHDMPDGKVWWKYHCQGKGRLCGWITCLHCKARVSLRTHGHIVADPDQAAHDPMCSDPLDPTKGSPQ